MKRLAASVIILIAISSVGYTYAQGEDQSDVVQEKAETSKDAKVFKRGPVDLAQFSKMDELKAADTNGDGTLSRDEIEAMVMKRMVERMANRAERRLDVNGDGKVTLDEIQKQKEKEFAALDRNDDGKLDRKELRAGHHGKKHDRHGKHGQHHKPMHKQN
ncbi:MAG: EF-hand domain-containing protein [Mesorhizobium sp.]